MTAGEASDWLEERWQFVLAGAGGDFDPAVDRFVNASVTSIRFAIVTQLLGKIADPRRDLLCLQKGVADSGEHPDDRRWDPRSFCVQVVVPWNRQNERVIGGSGDPYVSNPLRRPRLDEGLTNVHTRDRADWQGLADFLGALESAGDERAVRRAFEACLRSIADRLLHQRFEYPTPNRISLDQLCSILDRFLETPSGGLRSQVVATALMRVLGRVFSIFTRVDSQGLNEADRARNVPGDIMCYGPSDVPGQPDELRLVVDAKSARLRLAELQGSVVKARTSNVANFLFAAPGVAKDEDEAARISDTIDGEFVQGLNVHVTSIENLVRNTFMLLEEERRTELLHQIGTELDARTAPPLDRQTWSNLLANVRQR